MPFRSTQAPGPVRTVPAALYLRYKKDEVGPDMAEEDNDAAQFGRASANKRYEIHNRARRG
jgi:hypothetical protein